MINTSDPLERLKAVNPVPRVRTLPGPDPVLFDRIVAGEQVTGRRPAAVPTPLRARRLAPALVVASLFGGAVAYAILNDGVTKPQGVACYETADIEGRTEVVRVAGDGPLEACAALWRGGVLGRGGEVPTLVECVLQSGVAGVFPATPGDDVCARLELGTVPSTAPPPHGSTTPPPQDGADVNARFLAFRDAVLPQFLETPCMDPGAGAAIVRGELERAGLGDWTVVSDGFSAARPCATLAFAPERRQVLLVPAPAR